MDPSAPPVGWTDEKSPLSQPLPPPYHEYPGPGYPQPGPGYPQPGPGYLQPGQGYPQASQGYPQASQGYPQPGPGYPQPGPGYPQPGPGYPQPGPGYPPQPQGDVGPPPYGNAAYGQHPYPMGQQYPAQPALTAQPKVYVTPVVLANAVNDHMCYSVFTMLFCCLPLGIAALIYSISTRQAGHMGDRLGAEQSSRTARTLNNVALGLGLGVYVLFIVFIVVSFVF